MHNCIPVFACLGKSMQFVGSELDLYCLWGEKMRSPRVCSEANKCSISFGNARLYSCALKGVFSDMWNSQNASGHVVWGR